MTDLSIIIVCYKGWARLRKCLGALASFSGISFTTEVIVVDNRSDDENISEIEKEYPQFRIIHNDVNGGFANGCNLGTKNASGEYILFLNPDTIASESVIEQLLSIAKQNSGFTIISCRQVNEKGKESIASGEFPSIANLTGFQRAVFKRRSPQTAHRTPDIIFPDWISGSVILIRHDTFTKKGGFDEDFWMYFEDVDLCRRLGNTGGRIAFCKDITIEHNHGGSSRINLKTTALTKTEVHISRHVYFSKHKKGIEGVIIQLFLILNNMISGCVMAILGLILFFIPGVFTRTLIFIRLVRYYIEAAFRLSWISPRSMNFQKTKIHA